MKPYIFSDSFIFTGSLLKNTCRKVSNKTHIFMYKMQKEREGEIFIFIVREASFKFVIVLSFTL